MATIRGMIALSAVVAAVALGAVRREDPAPLRLNVLPQSTHTQAPVVPSRPAVDKSSVAQAKREQLIQKLIVNRIFLKTGVPGNLPRVWVGAPFYALEFDQKQAFVGVIYAYYFDGFRRDDVVRVFDGYTNKSIGQFTLSGLTLD